MTTSFGSREFRDALSCFATGVTIVTASDSGEPVGMTASSFNSVSLDPPLILWSVSKSAYSSEIFRLAPYFSVHILSSDQTDLANRFGRSGGDKFGDISYTLDSHNVPLLSDVSARFDCEQFATHEGGDHWIIVGRVTSLFSDSRRPLVFSSGSYASAHPIAPPSTSSLPPTSDDSASAPRPIDDLLVYHLSHAYHRLSERLHRAVVDEGLTVSEWRVLACLHGGSAYNRSELSTRTFVHPSALGDILLDLESRGFCVIGSDESVTGTSSGHDRVDSLFRLSAEDEADLFSDSSERENLVSILRRLTDAPTS